MTAEEYEAHVAAIVAAAPPLRPEQLSTLSALFATEAVEKGGAA